MGHTPAGETGCRCLTAGRLTEQQQNRHRPVTAACLLLLCVIAAAAAAQLPQPHSRRPANQRSCPSGRRSLTHRSCPRSAPRQWSCARSPPQRWRRREGRRCRAPPGPPAARGPAQTGGDRRGQGHAAVRRGRQQGLVSGGDQAPWLPARRGRVRRGVPEQGRQGRQGRQARLRQMMDPVRPPSTQPRAAAGGSLPAQRAAARSKSACGTWAPARRRRRRPRSRCQMRQRRPRRRAPPPRQRLRRQPGRRSCPRRRRAEPPCPRSPGWSRPRWWACSQPRRHPPEGRPGARQRPCGTDSGTIRQRSAGCAAGGERWRGVAGPGPQRGHWGVDRCGQAPRRVPGRPTRLGAAARGHARCVRPGCGGWAAGPARPRSQRWPQGHGWGRGRRAVGAGRTAAGGVPAVDWAPIGHGWACPRPSPTPTPVLQRHDREGGVHRGWRRDSWTRSRAEAAASCATGGQGGGGGGVTVL